MKIIIIALLCSFFLLSFQSKAFYKGIQYKQSDICKKLKTDYWTAYEMWDKNYAVYFNRSHSPIDSFERKELKEGESMSYLLRYRKNRAKTGLHNAMKSEYIALKTAIENKCFKQTRSCISSIRDYALRSFNRLKRNELKQYAVSYTSDSEQKHIINNVMLYCSKTQGE